MTDLVNDEVVNFLVKEAIAQVKERFPGMEAGFYMAGAEVILEDALKLLQRAREHVRARVKQSHFDP